MTGLDLCSACLRTLRRRRRSGIFRRLRVAYGEYILALLFERFEHDRILRLLRTFRGFGISGALLLLRRLPPRLRLHALGGDGLRLQARLF